ncbi:alanine racemase [Patescibacteria group bacterium]|jgi:alanine racemase|nr:alanine racemase [Patescibacteria group bacterium]
MKTWIEIDGAALSRNFRSLSRLAKPAKTMAVIKANAYGHGLLETAHVLKKSGAAWFGVDHVDEALELRKAGIKQPILILGYTPLSRLSEAVQKDISLVAYNLDTFRALAKLKGKKARVHVPIETGLTRQGIGEVELDLVLACLVQNRGRIQLEGIHTHFANIEDTKSRSYADHQISEYKKAIGKFEAYKLYPTFKHTASTAASILYSDTHFDLVRTGIGLYGLWPSEDTRGRAQHRLKLEPVLSWKTMVAQVKSVKRGTPVSYGLTERVRRDSKVAVLPIGYADGFDRVANSKQGHVLVGGKRCKVLGRVCMNMTMVDVTDVQNVRPEDEVVLIGKQGKERITAEELATLQKTINYEVVTRLNWDIPRKLI